MLKHHHNQIVQMLWYVDAFVDRFAFQYCFLGALSADKNCFVPFFEKRTLVNKFWINGYNHFCLSEQIACNCTTYSLTAQQILQLFMQTDQTAQKLDQKCFYEVVFGTATPTFLVKCSWITLVTVWFVGAYTNTIIATCIIPDHCVGPDYIFSQ